MCRWEGQYPIWEPDDPLAGTLDRLFAWLAHLAHSEVARSSTEGDEPLPRDDGSTVPWVQPVRQRE